MKPTSLMMSRKFSMMFRAISVKDPWVRNRPSTIQNESQ
jgi:hypothetical protein